MFSSKKSQYIQYGDLTCKRQTESNKKIFKKQQEKKITKDLLSAKRVTVSKYEIHFSMISILVFNGPTPIMNLTINEILRRR